MSDEKKLVVVVTNGLDDERSSVAWSVANGAIGSNMQVTMFLVSSGVDWVRKGAAEQARPNPLDPPVKDMIQTVVDSGGKILVCPPCAGVRGYDQDDRSRFRPWLFRILHNCFVSNYRRKAVRPTESQFPEDGDDGLATLLNEQPDEFLIWWANPEREFFNNVLGDAIVAAIEQLPEAFRAAILLINGEGLTYDEAAEALGVPQGTIRSRMKRGRTMLQKALWEQARDAGLAGPGDTNRHDK